MNNSEHLADVKTTDDTYRPICKCGWLDTVRYLDSEKALQIAKAHAERNSNMFR